MDPIVGAWLDDPECESFEYDDLQQVYLSPLGGGQPLRSGESNLQAFAQDFSSLRMLWPTIRDVLERADLMHGFRFEMLVPPVLASAYRHPPPPREQLVNLILSCALLEMELAGIGCDTKKLETYRKYLEVRS